MLLGGKTDSAVMGSTVAGKRRAFFGWSGECLRNTGAPPDHPVKTIGNLSALLLTCKRFRRIIPGFVQTGQYAGSAGIKFRFHYHPAGPVTIGSAVGKLAALVTKLVYSSTDLRYFRAAREIQTVTGSETTVRRVYWRD